MSKHLDPNQTVTLAGVDYRLCVYETVVGWGSFAESPEFYLGSAGAPTRRLAAIRALRLIVAEAAAA